MRIKDVKLCADDADVLRQARRQLRAVEQAHRRYQIAQAERPLVSSPRLDGMPRGSLKTSGLEKRYISLDRYRQRLELEERKLKKVQEEAQRIIYSLPDALQDFCHWYYLEGMSMQDVAAYIDRDISTCWRHKKLIERDLGGMPPQSVL